jgi:hypothetical protein
VLLKVLLACGILSSLLYAAMNVFVPMLWDGYTMASQTVSELSAIGAPTRTLWVRLGASTAFFSPHSDGAPGNPPAVTDACASSEACWWPTA